MATFYCYIVECADGTYYTGWTTDPQRRLRQHAAGRGARYTKAHPPARLAFVEIQPDRATAMRRERALKRLARSKKQDLINNGPISVVELPKAPTRRARAAHPANAARRNSSGPATATAARTGHHPRQRGQA